MKLPLRLVSIVAAFLLAPALLVGGLPGSASALTLNPELRELTGENPFARNVYLCNCTFEQYLAAPLPGPSWEKNSTAINPRYLIADETVSIAPAPPLGTPASLDLVPEIAGDDHEFIARVLSGTVIGFGAQGAFARPQVARNTTLTYDAGSVLHTVTDTSGTEFVLFSMDGASTATYDPTVVGGLGGLDLPAGWSYESEVLASELVVVTPGGVANLFSQGNDIALWQELVPVPEPATSLQLLAGVFALAMRSRRRA
ncbi:MAG: hypothetical protein AAF430_24815 [Myxococcota bacterium]